MDGEFELIVLFIIMPVHYTDIQTFNYLNNRGTHIQIIHTSNEE